MLINPRNPKSGVTGLSGGKLDPFALALETRRKNWIRNAPALDVDPLVKAEARKFHLPVASTRRLRTQSGIYNCFGLVFGARRTWIMFPEDVEMTLRDDGYRDLGTDDQNLCVGDVAIYRKVAAGEITHAGVVMQIQPDLKRARNDVLILSQWGSDGEFIHLVDDVPATFGSYRHYYTDRPQTGK